MKAALLAVSIAWMAIGCEREPGRAELAFAWASAPEDPRALYAFLRVEEVASGSVLSAPPAVLLGDRGSSSELQVPSGDQRKVVVEIRRGPWSNGRVIFAGETPVFDLHAGDVVRLEATLRAVEDAPPAAPGPSLPRGDQLRFLRNPWGSSDGLRRPRFAVEGRAGAVEPGTRVVVFDRAEIESAVVLGRSRAGADGAFSCELDDVSASTAVEVFIAAAGEDDALSDANDTPGLQAMRIAEVRWTATMIGKEPDRTFPNPHRLVITTQNGAALYPDPKISAEPSAPELADAALTDETALRADHRPTWSKHLPGRSPLERSATALAFVPASGRTLLFGGFSDRGRLGDTWEWDGSTWSEVEGFGPSPRNRHAMAYHAASDRAVLFGGASIAVEAGNLGDTWLWSADSRTWTLVQDAGSDDAEERPAPRSDHGMAYDSKRGEVVMFGGIGADGTRLGDTWIWDGQRWNQRFPDQSPPPRGSGLLAYDARRGVTVLYSGVGFVLGQLDVIGDTWEWDGERWHGPLAVGVPRARIGSGIAYDEANGAVVIFGGVQVGAFLDSAWAWDGQEWNELAQSGKKPRRRAGGAMAYDTQRRRLILFGGETLTNEPFDTRLGDTWERDGEQWIERTPSGVQPSPRTNPPIAYDRAREEVILFGGTSPAPGPLGDTWSFGHRGWIQHTGLAQAPPALEAGAMAYDDASSTTLLFGGAGAGRFLDETWIWDGTTWFHRQRASKPSARAGHRLVAEARSGRILLFGGVGNDGLTDDSWAWDGNDWAPLDAPRPGPRLLQGMTYDADRQTVVMFGGRDSSRLLDDLWEWDGSAWSDRSAELRPSPRDGPSLEYSRGRAASLLCGGLDLRGSNDGCWEWDGTGTWSALLTGGAEPIPRGLAGSAYDERNDRWVLAGGGEQDLSRVFDETWILETPRDGRPAALLTVDWNASRASRDAVSAIEVRAVAGGSGGVEASVWDAVAGRWVEVALDDSPADRFGVLSFRTSEAPLRLIRHNGELHVRLRPRVGGRHATIAVDSVEVAVETR